METIGSSAGATSRRIAHRHTTSGPSLPTKLVCVSSKTDSELERALRLLRPERGQNAAALQVNGATPGGAEHSASSFASSCLVAMRLLKPTCSPPVGQPHFVALPTGEQVCHWELVS